MIGSEVLARSGRGDAILLNRRCDARFGLGGSACMHPFAILRDWLGGARARSGLDDVDKYLID